ncbi:FAD-dependent monooxygenase [Kutzneria viridogrisea]|uniref:2-polyprenyl-6-methoxyphenol hydroxylase-like FAD-dependent oxidoreductase n=1 Tax=Kutzneria viridogrisea TaxID=47990 RepID=A0ABR6BMM4_9PSEU|nr:2-polyprenyl-6-methoxyphenol hydroxylase-like FAD-dependent oxidoreductase [Kutzneria viridogrisea]
MTGVLVIGGGIAGTAAALALHKAGAEVTVFEAQPVADEDIGAFLTLASNGTWALTQIDCAEPVHRVGFPLTAMRLTGENGDQLAAAPMGDPANPVRCLRRAELGAALREEAGRRGIDLRHGKRLTGISQDEHGVTASFADGSTATGSLLVGADGLNSVVRAGAGRPRYAGQRVYYGYTTEAAPPHEPARIEMIRGSRSSMGYAVSPAGQTYWFLRVPAEQLSGAEIAAATPASLREHLLPLVSPDQTPAADIVAATGEQLMVTNARDLPEGLRWRDGRVLLIGDAAHAASPATGQGASMALEDAVVLGKSIRDLGLSSAALAAYERIRRPRVEQNIATSARITAAPTNSPATPARRPPVDPEVLAMLDWNAPVSP